ncbi:dual 3 -5 -cyclic-AMP and -GMP phosphodiesterase 11 isoform X1, partial [Brachionus plicatilis]
MDPMNDSDSLPNLDTNVVSSWLDNHPEFLQDYLKKLQIQRRRTSLLSDKSGLLLASFNTACNKKSSIQETNFPEPLTSPVQNNSKLAKYSSPNSNTASLKSLFLNSTSLNPSFSEPNLPPANQFSQVEHENAKKQVSRNKFRQLSLYEKMYTLVKCLYQSLDLRTTCKKILNTVSLLLDADRCSLFLVVDEDDYVEANAEGTNGMENGKNKKILVSVVFDAKSKCLNKFVKNYAFDSLDEGSIDEDDGEQIKIPYGKGIVGYVASTGESVNIIDAYSDPRFNATIDQKTGYKTKSILCLPILNENGQCIAVAEAINKLGDETELEENNNSEEISFTREDEELPKRRKPNLKLLGFNTILKNTGKKYNSNLNLTSQLQSQPRPQALVQNTRPRPQPVVNNTDSQENTA